MTLADMQTMRDALAAARFRGVRSVSVEGRSVTYGSDAEMKTALADLDVEIERATAGRPSRHVFVSASKGL